ncbi:oxoglutarate dehydrogenase, E1 component [Halteromyces radiatus]|uniref:oxoglutarate dehydrogenase, E1 component n=1 Tax=Halteromyces radiatus TaxID=101107 RepID=UPI00221ED3FE|nr:oxoglutarate dehydrogenase, E1 component [Halteromyces radiatus]KAI8096651.1 oxoglutarate dehydrogenase, E1 component [Halteromyces radiatus]
MYRLSTLSRTGHGPFYLNGLLRQSSIQFTRYLSSSRNDFNESNSYVDAMYEAWLQDAKSVDKSWQTYFEKVSPSKGGFGARPHHPDTLTYFPSSSARLPVLPGEQIAGQDPQSKKVADHMRIQLLSRAYQVRGHHIAKLDPLGIQFADREHTSPPELQHTYYGFTDKDLDREFTIGPGILPTYHRQATTMTLRKIIEQLQRIYCGSIGIEYVHIPDRDQCEWIRSRVENPVPYKYSVDEKRMILDRLIWSDSFERFVASKYPSEKRFGLEGGESLIPGMKALIDRSVDLGVESIVIGMPHRGRLNVLSNVVRKPNESIFCEFSGSNEPSVEGSGDVKYHLGMNYERPTPSGKRVHLSLVANPSHLEAVNPVVLGKTCAIQYLDKGGDQNKAMAVLMHGDAAFAGQGVVYETMGFYDLPAYSTGGTIHIIVNNQIGFTTDPISGRSTPYCTDIAKSIDAPIFHVNGNDVEAVTYVMQLASEWRQTFNKDVVIDLVCYRKHGHNETDQPSFTQPQMYEAIGKQVPVVKQYEEKLVKENTLSQKEIDENTKRVWSILEQNFEKSKTHKPTSSEWQSTSWPGCKSPKEVAEEILPGQITGVNKEVLEHIGKALTTLPDGFHVHRSLKRILQNRDKSVQEGNNIDWATAEALAWGSLLMEGHHIRMSGQDVERGTFSQRHSVVFDQKTGTPYNSLNHISPEQKKLSISNSSLSEFGVLGFELGYSLVDPNTLVMWEAQFGDFANNAQCIVDQFIAAGEQKWLQRTGLVMTLPHGYDGQGPEHSSARIERYLLLCDDSPYVYPSDIALQRQIQDCNMQVVYPSTPAQYFHVLRRQIHRPFRKPLILPFSKSLLRHPLAKSSLDELTGDTIFQSYLPEVHPAQLQKPEDIKKHILCTGQVYYSLLKAREENKVTDIAISRIEQLNPFPYQQVKEHVDKYPNAEIIWLQEEPMNAGAWQHVQPRITTALSQTQYHTGKQPHYTGRPPSASVATGNKKKHFQEEYNFLSHALFGESIPPNKIVSGGPVW